MIWILLSILLIRDYDEAIKSEARIEISFNVSMMLPPSWGLALEMKHGWCLKDVFFSTWAKVDVCVGIIIVATFS